MAAPILRSISVRDIKCGERVVIVEPSNLYECELADDVFIGPFVEIQAGVTVGRATRVQSHAFLCEGVTIGSDCFISHAVLFINDTFSRGSPANRDRSLWRRTAVGSRVSMGSGAIILPVSICDGAVIGAGAVVTRDIDIPGVYAGNPARLVRTL